VGRYNAFAIGGAINEAALRTLQTPILTAELQRRWAAARAATERKQIDVPPMQNDNDRLGGNVKYFADLPATKGYQLMVVFPRDDLMTFGSQGPFGGVSIPPVNGGAARCQAMADDAEFCLVQLYGTGTVRRSGFYLNADFCRCFAPKNPQLRHMLSSALYPMSGPD
jgi:hypothetical protein